MGAPNEKFLLSSQLRHALLQNGKLLDIGFTPLPVPSPQFFKSLDLEVDVRCSIAQLLALQLVIEIDIGQGSQQILQKRLEVRGAHSGEGGPVSGIFFVKLSIVHPFPRMNFTITGLNDTNVELPRLLGTRQSAKNV